jgi:hypothetical protein
MKVADECAFALATSFTKLSMLILTRRVSANGSTILGRLAVIVIVIVALEAFIFCFVVVFTCR